MILLQFDNEGFILGKKKKTKSKKKQFWGLPKEIRIENAKAWIETYDGENIVKTYAKMYGLNLKNAMKELGLIGVHINSEEREQIKRLIKERNLQKERKKEKRKRKALEIDAFNDFDDTFAFIAGYTEGGAPFGITYEEMDEINKNEN
ncbi:hypothetical protein [Neobacillus vireti]|uniref:Phage protein n=1 Tax=Neobacillus vireti LMG 21834 TaxID=1131730 RepID=A0AB94IHZ5_9BACI|nr:hypothetical protein [Neobacillus vireti]ETI66642.1 hypothetical protein BAVI_21583 [Neobacillus vireti LMG 21834]